MEGLCVRVRVGVAVLVNVEVAAEVAVFVDVELGELVGPSDNVSTNCGGWLPWREEKVAASVLSAARTKLNVPFACTHAVTSYSAQVLVLILPLLSSAPLRRPGRVFQVIVVSVQEIPVA